MEKGTFSPLVFSTTGGMGDECNRFHKRLAELLSIKKGEKYADTISCIWIRSKVSFALIRSALLCLRGLRSTRRTFDTSNVDFNLENVIARLN